MENYKEKPFEMQQAFVRMFIIKFHGLIVDAKW